MTESLADFLNEIGADASTIQSAVRLVAAEMSDYLPAADMRAQLVDVADDEAAVQAALDTLASDSATLLEADTAALSALWSDPETQPMVRDALLEAKSKLPVIEVALIVLAALYALHMVLTRGVASSETTVEHKADGSWSETTRVVYSDPTGPLGVIAGIFRGRSTPPADGG